MAILTRAAGRDRSTRIRSWLAGFRSRETWAAYGFLSPWFVGFVVFTAGPMVASLVLSFTDYDVITRAEFVGLDNYREMLSDPKVTSGLVNTLVYTLMRVPGTMLMALLMAMTLLRIGRAAGFFRTVFYLPTMTPGVAVGILFLLLFNGQIGLVNKALELVGLDGPGWTTDPHWVKPGLALMSLWAVGGTMVIYLAALKNVPEELYEAAQLDGASAWQQFRKVTLPQISSALFFTFIVLTIHSLQTFDEVYTAFFGNANSQGYSSDAALFYVIYLFQQAFQFLHMGYASALAWLLFLIIMVVTAVQVIVSRRYVYYEGGE